MVVDTSAVVAILFEEADQLRYAEAIEGAQARHPAALNIGDCFSYALASATGHPLLFKGNDFAQTDIRSALT